MPANKITQQEMEFFPDIAHGSQAALMEFLFIRNRLLQAWISDPTTELTTERAQTIMQLPQSGEEGRKGEGEGERGVREGVRKERMRKRDFIPSCRQDQSSPAYPWLPPALWLHQLWNILSCESNAWQDAVQGGGGGGRSERADGCQTAHLLWIGCQHSGGSGRGCMCALSVCVSGCG